MSQGLKEKILSKKAKIAVVGLGYVGLPLAVSFARKGFVVYGIDKDADRINRLKKRESYITDLKTSELNKICKTGRFQVAMDFKSINPVDIVIICVPTPLKRKYTPDIAYIISSIREVNTIIRRGMLVVLESTTYPGTTDELIKPELEKSGLKAGRDFHVAFSPERIDPGNKNYDVTRIPKLVGGITLKCGQLTQILYEQIIQEVHLLSTARAAEMTKLLENTFRIINIGWINEIAMMCHKMNINIWEVIDAAKTKPFGFMPFYPGLGVGGHCIPDDPLYLYWKAKKYGFSSKFIKLAADINNAMPQYAINTLREILRKRGKNLSQSKVLVLGVTYKKDVKDLRKSPSLKLLEILKKSKAFVDYHDPIIPYLKINDLNLKSVPLNAKTIARYDCVVVAVDHTQVNYDLLRRKAKMIYDIKNVYKNITAKNIVRF